MVSRLLFPKKRRLPDNREFKAVLARRICAHDKFLTVCVAENHCGCSRLGVSVGKSCGGAVLRNRVKRLLREAFRQSQHVIPGGFDYVVMVSPQLGKELRESCGQGRTQGLAFEKLKASLLDLTSAAVQKASKRSPKESESREKYRENDAQRP